jgi:hypothetical protein
MTRYEILTERLKQALPTFEAGREYAVWVNREAEILALWPVREPINGGYMLAGVFTRQITLQELVEAAMYALTEGA